MAKEKPTVCFTCGQPVSENGRTLNLLENGAPCPACRDRLLDSLPPLLPSRRPFADDPAVGVEERGQREDLGFDDGPMPA